MKVIFKIHLGSLDNVIQADLRKYLIINSYQQVVLSGR